MAEGNGIYMAPALRWTLAQEFPSPFRPSPIFVTLLAAGQPLSTDTPESSQPHPDGYADGKQQEVLLIVK